MTNTFDKILENLDNSSRHTREKGTQFERLVLKILKLSPSFKNSFKQSYLWDEFSTKFEIKSQDTGIDIMALDYDDKWTSIQCKFFNKKKIDQKDLGNFLGINKIIKSNGEHFCDISNKYIFHTSKDSSSNFTKAISQATTKDNEIKVFAYYDIKDNLNINWDDFDLDDLNTLKLYSKKSLRPHQEKALKAIKKAFLEDKLPRAKIIMACGTGKSLLSIHTIDKIVNDGEIALFFAPSLALINQMLIEFFKESSSPAYKVLAVCSDNKISHSVNSALEDIAKTDIIIPIIQDSANLSHQINRNKKSKIIIFSTYQSIDIVIDAQKELLKIDNNFIFKLIINDEAHRTAGYDKLIIKDDEKIQKTISIWQKTHDNDLIKAHHRLYMTATPRIYNDTQKAIEHELSVYSMDDEIIFGKEIYTLKFKDAILDDILCDYRIIISFINKDTAQALINTQGKDYKADDISKMLGLYKAIVKKDLYLLDKDSNNLDLDQLDQNPMHRIVAFHSSIKNSKFFKSEFNIIDPSIDPNCTEHIDGTDNANIKSSKLEWLKNIPDDDNSFKILSNAKCLTEGIDVPSLDAVAFFDPRDSVVDIIQAIGRVMRRSEGKKYGYIILPISLSEEEIKDYDKTLSSQAFKNIYKALRAIRSHDESLIDSKRIDQVVQIITPKQSSPGSFGSDSTTDIYNSLFTLKELSSHLKLAIPKKLGDLAYWELYASKVGSIMHDLSNRIKDLYKNNTNIKNIFKDFLKALQLNLNKNIDTNEAIFLISQHIITKPIFGHIFPNLNFNNFDKISQSLEKLYNSLLDHGLKAELEVLTPFYNSIQSNAQYAQSDKSKQDLIRHLYDSLFKSAFKKTQEKLGIVYTPIEVVDFIIHSVEYVLKKHFNKSLKDENIHILDPFTGTGSFITRLIQSGLLDDNLEYKYSHELWANEITLLAYYIAQLNITSVYHEKIKDDNYKLFNNLLFTDTFETYDIDSKGYKGPKKEKNIFEPTIYLEENLKKINEFKNQEFKVILGNPPYSANQRNGNDNNKNTSYPILDERIANTYVSTYKVQKFKYDSFKRAMRYASDRIENSGIVAFVSNGSFIDSNSDAGLRACLEKEFDYIYIFNLRGNIRKNMQTKDGIEGENIFGNASQTPVAIYLLVKCGMNTQKATIYYYDINSTLNINNRKTIDKLNLITNLKSIKNLENKWQLITPNIDYDWIEVRDYNYLKFMSIGDKKLKFKALDKNKINLFEVFSMGIVSNRDVWTYNFSKENLAQNMKFMIKNYNEEVEKKSKNKAHKAMMDKSKIKWTRALLSDFNKNIKFDFETSGLVVPSLYRPFTKCHLYLAKHFNEMLCQMPQIYPTPQTTDINILDCEAESVAYIKDFVKHHKYLPNLCICIDEGGQTGAIITNFICDLHFCSQTQAFPLYYYEKIDNIDLFDNSKNYYINYRRKDAIRDEALYEIRRIYKDDKISKIDIFYYIYALLNHKIYKEKYKYNLSKMLPRIPFYKDFYQFSKIGQELANLHINYESYYDKSDAKIIPNKENNIFSKIDLDFLNKLKEDDFRFDKLRFLNKNKKDIIIFNDKLLLSQIPPKAYEYIVNGKSAIEWIMDRYQVKIDKDSGILNDPNLFECDSGHLKGYKGGKYVLYLLLSIIKMSTLSVELLESLSKLPLDEV